MIFARFGSARPPSDLDELRARRNRLEVELNRRLGPSPSVEVDPEELAASLPARAALVDFFEHRVYEPGNPTQCGQFSAPHLSAWITRTDGAIAHVDLGPSAPLAGAVRAFLENLVARRGVEATTQGSAPS